MPAEWEAHAATWIAWPHQREDWPGKFGPVPWVYTEIVRHLTRFEAVFIVIRDREMKRQALERLAAAGVDLERVQFFEAETDRSWLRDSGPTFVVKEQAHFGESDRLGLIDWKFTGWARYDDYRQDNRLPRQVENWTGIARWVPRIEKGGRQVRVVMEGGAIDVNGRGTLLTTEECLLSGFQARNPGLDRADLERAFADYLGIRQVVWLDRGIAGDDTHGHVDDLARFVNPRTVALVVAPSSDSLNYEPLLENRRRLRAAYDQDGQYLNVVDLPMPRPIVFNGQRLPASYANFYVANGVVLVPTFNDPADRVALNTIAHLFPKREVVGIHSVDLILGLGALHCLTQQQPV
jgi:agmatine deiminase